MLSALAVSGYRSLRDLGHPARSAEPRHRTERQRQIEPVSRAAAARRDRAGARHSVARAGRRPRSRRCGPARIVFASRAPRRPPGPGSRPEEAGQPATWASPATTSATRSISACRHLRAGAFGHDPEIKRECVWSRPDASALGRAGRSPRSVVKRGKRKATGRSSRTSWPRFDSMMTHCADPRNTPEMLMLREEMRAWRFYDHFRTDATAPARAAADRHAHAGVEPRRRRPGRGAPDDPPDRRCGAVDAAIDDAFPGARVAVTHGERLVRGRDAAARPASSA